MNQQTFTNLSGTPDETSPKNEAKNTQEDISIIDDSTSPLMQISFYHVID